MKHIYFILASEDGHLVVLIVVEDNVSKCNKCYAYGHIRIQDLVGILNSISCKATLKHYICTLCFL